MTSFVFFDVGETLVSPDPSWSEVAVDLLRERGHEVEVDDLRRAWAEVGGMFEEAHERGERFSLSAEASHRFWTTLYARQMEILGVADEAAPQLLYDTFSDPATYRLFDDARPAFDALRDRGLRLGIISNFESWLRDLLTRLDIVDLFDAVVISGEVGYEKPDREIFDLALEMAGVEPGQAAHVGDSRPFDAEAATGYGLRGVLLDRHDRHTDVDGAFPRIRTLSELVDVL